MIRIESSTVETELLNAVNELKTGLSLTADIDLGCVPGEIGIRSQVLLTIMGKLESVLGISIPNNCYIFCETKTNRKLSIKEAAQKLIKVSKYAK